MADPGTKQQIWRPLRACPPLELQEVHLWRVTLDAQTEQVESLTTLLSPAERARAALERDGVRFVVGRGVLRRVLAGYTGADPSQLLFEYGPRGKPALTGQWAPALQFNVSHSNGIALYAVARMRRVGVDVEFLRSVPDAVRIAQRYFSPNEAAVLRLTPPDRLRTTFFRCWTRKEAYVKAVGEGLSLPLDTFEVSVADHDLAALRSISGSATAAARWTIHDLAPGAGYCAAVAFERLEGDVTCCCFEFRL